MNRPGNQTKKCHFGHLASNPWLPQELNEGISIGHAEILHRFYGAPTMTIYRDFMVSRLCQFTDILQRFHGAPTTSIYIDCVVSRLCQFTGILHDKTKPLKIFVSGKFTSIVRRYCQVCKLWVLSSYSSGCNLQTFYKHFEMNRTKN